MLKGIFTLLLLFTATLPAIAAPGAASGPWGIDISTFTNLSTAKRSPTTAGKLMVISKTMNCGNLTIPADRSIKVIPGGKIRYSGNLVIQGSFEAGLFKALEKVGSGSVTGIKNPRPEWFGGLPDDALADGDAFIEAMASGSGTFTASSGTYLWDKKVPFTLPILCAGSNSTIFKLMTPFTGEMMLDFNSGADGKFIKGCAFDGNATTAVHGWGSSAFNYTAGTGTPSGSSKSHFEDIWFKTFNDPAWPVNAPNNTTTPAGGGMLTGSTGLNVRFDGCARWIRAGTNQDDIKWIGTRFNGVADTVAGHLPTDYPLRLSGHNVTFDDYYMFASKQANPVYQALISIGGNGPFDFDHSFYESAAGVSDQNLQAIMMFDTPGAKVIHKNSYLQFDAGITSLVGLIRLNERSDTTAERSLTLINNRVNPAGRIPNLVNIYYPSSVTTGTTINIAGNGGYSSIYGWVAGSTVNKWLTRLIGEHQGQGYNHFITSGDTTSLLPISPADNSYLQTMVQAASAASNAVASTFTLPTQGTWLITIAARVNDNVAHIALGTYIVNYSDSTYDILTTDIIGTAKFSAGSVIGVNGLTVSAPATTGVITLHTTWTDGQSYPVRYVITGRKLNRYLENTL
jgi:hypothetical protein